MTPARQDPGRFRRPTGRLLGAVLGVLLLVLLFAPARDAVTHGLTVEWRPAAELAFLLFVVTVGAVTRPQIVAASYTARMLAVIVVVMAVLNLVDAATPTLLGRDLNLYWDLPHLPSLFGLAGDAAGFWRMAGVTAILAGAIVLLINGTGWAWRQVLAVLTDRRIGLGFAVVLGAVLDVTAFMPAEERPLATGLGLDIVRQSVALVRGWHAPSGGPYAAALAAPAPPHSDLAGLKRRDVYLVYLESYGTTVFDTPEFRAGLGDTLSQFETSLRRAGYTIASNRLVSPTFGGGSWLAHATLASGVRLDDPVLYTLLLDSGRKLLPAYLKEAGWRTIDIAPGIKAPSPRATAAWGFDREIFARELDYRGPPFGWFAIPDQFTLDRAAMIRSELGPSPPVFTQLVLVSSHIPFAPVPPYLTDWGDSGSFASVPATAMEEISRQPDWTNLAPDYLASLRYDFDVLTGWLTRRISEDGLVILLGDHQPPAIIRGQPEPPWTVPIHVLSRDPDLIAPFLAEGYISGLDPTQAPPHPGMETFLARFLAAFDRPG
ncbi:MAG: hypothetical protein JO282_08635 [Alphaproteobacteria bacterium]|nr:hypothetical protein [Alphaproteobacteria bacterium]